jgi:hypothetical protein
MGTLKGNMDVLQGELGGRISALHKKLDSTLCKVDDKISHMDENLNKTMGSLTQTLDMLCALIPRGQGSMGSSTLDDSTQGSPRGFAPQSVPN